MSDDLTPQPAPRRRGRPRIGTRRHVLTRPDQDAKITSLISAAGLLGVKLTESQVIRMLIDEALNARSIDPDRPPYSERPTHAQDSPQP